MLPINPKLKFIDTDSYIIDLAEELKKGFDYSKIICFKITGDKMLQSIVPYLIDGLKRGAKVDIEGDTIFSRYKLAGSLITLPIFSLSKRKQAKALVLQQVYFTKLLQSGAKISFNNSASWFNINLYPFVGRDHRKVIFIQRGDEKICYFGATNFDEGALNDFMLKTNDHEIYDNLFKINSKEALLENQNDVSLKMADQEFILDYGNPFQSKILDTGNKIIREATKTIRFVSQLPPEFGLMIRFVRARMRGVKVEIVLPSILHKNIRGFPYIIAYLYDVIVSMIFRIKIFHTIKYFTHAKILMADKKVLLGSHNMSSIGVIVGTRELSVLLNDAEIWENTNTFIDNLIGKNV